MHRSARTAHTIRPSRSGSSTMQPATGQAAWQIEHANAPKQRSGSMTAIVFGAFLRGPDIILVHMARNYTELPEEVADRGVGLADLRHVREEARRVLVDSLERIGAEVPRIRGIHRIGRDLESLARI